MNTRRTQVIEEEASAWLIRRDSGEWTPGDEACLEEWLDASSLHRVAFWRLEEAWKETTRLKALGAGVVSHQPPPRGEWNLGPFFDSSYQDVRFESDDTLGPQPDIPAKPSNEGTRVPKVRCDLAVGGLGPMLYLPSRTKRRRRYWAIASGACALLAGASVYLSLKPSGDRYTTPIGGLASVPLQDGSNITLNTATEVRVALTGRERDIELARGEAYFEVAKDTKRPFVVNVGKKRVIAVGTQFSVLRDGDEIRVVVSEGTVRIEDRPRTALAPALPLTVAGSARAVLLSAGSVALTRSAGVLVQKETESKTQEQLSWRTGVLMFRDQTLGAVAAEFNRYNERQIVINDPTISNLKIEGNFRSTNVDAFVRLLESGFPVRATEIDSKIVLSAN
jgi:transmembrane sensor